MGETPGLEIRLFGVCEMRAAGQPLPPPRHRKDLWLLALLILRGDRDVPRDWLAVTLWPDADESQALYNLRRSLSQLRQALGTEAHRLLSPTARTVRFDLADAFADVAAFDKALGTDPTQEELAQAVALYRGPLLADCQEEWVLPERNAYEQAYLGALENLAQKILARGEPVAAVRPLRLLVAADPYRESASVLLMQALARSGDRAALRQVYHALRAVLRRDLNTDPAPETQAVYRQLSAESARPAALPEAVLTERASGRHLPVPLTDLIGRQAEIKEVVGWLGQARLVTLLGPGGVGKTRLAIGAAEEALASFADGAWFVDLAPLTEAGGVADAAARALGMTEQAGQPPEARLASALAERSLLLVLDNCEHLLPACAALVSGLLASCPGLRVLATSREPLGLTGEQSFRVPALATPPETEDGRGEKPTTALLEYAAVRLFAERAAQAAPGLRRTPATLTAMAAVCRRLDGIPLAIELAAARVRSLSVEEVNTRLDQRFRLLTGGSRAALPRQQTLRALVDWSYNLLTPSEKAFLCRMAVFAGGWTLEAAEAVCAGDGTADFEALDLLTALVDKSLVVAETADGQTRYRLLETIREYAAERLTAGDGGLEKQVRARHRDWFLDWIEGKFADAYVEWSVIGPEFAGRPSRPAAEAGRPAVKFYLSALEADHDNLRAALAWSLAEETGAEAGLRMGKVLTLFWGARGYRAEGLTWAERLLARPGAQDPALSTVRARLLVRASFMALYRGDPATGERWAQEALGLVAAAGDDFGEQSAADALGELALWRGDHAGATAWWDRALALSRMLGNRGRVSYALEGLARIALGRGDLDRAWALSEEALALGREAGASARIGDALVTSGWIAHLRGDFAAAQARAAEGLERFRSYGDLPPQGQALMRLGLAEAELGRLEEARGHWEEGLRLLRRMEELYIGLYSLQAWSFLLWRLGQPGASARVLGAAQTLMRARGQDPCPADIEAQYGEFISGQVLKEALGADAFAAAYEAGSRLTWEEAVDEATAPRHLL